MPNTTYPNGIDQVASITNDITAARTISLNQMGITLGQLEIGDNVSVFNAFTISSGVGGTFNFDVSSGSAYIRKFIGNSAYDVIYPRITLYDDLIVDIQIAPGGINMYSRIDELEPGKQLLKIGTGGGALQLLGYNTFSGGLTLNGGLLTIYSGTALGKGTFTINGGTLNCGYPELSNTWNNAQIWNEDLIFSASQSLNLGNGDVLLSNHRQINITAGYILTIGGAISDGGAGYGLTKVGTTGYLYLSGTNSTFKGRTYISEGVLMASSLNRLNNPLPSSSLGAPTTVANATIYLGSGANAGWLRYVGAGETTDRPINLYGTTGGGVIQNYGSGPLVFTTNFTVTTAGSKSLTLDGSNDNDNAILGAIVNGAGTISFVKAGVGRWRLAGPNNFSGASTLSAGTLVLDYSSYDNSKLADASALTLGGTYFGTLVLSGGSHTEVISATTIGAGGARLIRESGSSKLRMNAITRNAFSTIDFTSEAIADTDTTNVNGILGGWATVGGTNWAKNATQGADGNIVAYTDYVVGLPTSGGSATNNYYHQGPLTLAGALSAYTIKLENSANSETMALGANNLTVGWPGVWLGAIRMGGLLYVGGYDNQYTISGTGIIGAGSTNEFIVNVYTGTLTIATPIIGAGAGTLTKIGGGRLKLSSASSFTGAIRVNEGILRLANNTAAGTTAGGITVNPNTAALELEGNIAIGAEALSLGGFGPDGSGALKNISGNNSYAGAITLVLDGARINSESGNLTLSGGITTALLRDLYIGGAGNVSNITVAISGAGNLIKDGSGILTLGFANTFSGRTFLNSGTIRLNNATGLGGINTARVRFGSGGGILQLNGYSPTLIEIEGDASGIIENGAAAAVTLTINNMNDVHFAGTIRNGGTGALNLTKGASTAGAGVLKLTGTNQQTGIVTINNGYLEVPELANGGVPCPLGAAPAAAANLVFGGGVLRYTGPSVTIDRNFTITASTVGGIDVADPNTVLTMPGATGGATTGCFVKEGAGTLKLSGVNTFTGGTIIRGGTLAYGILNALPNGPIYIHGTNSVLDIGRMSGSTVQISFMMAV